MVTDMLNLLMETVSYNKDYDTQVNFHSLLKSNFTTPFLITQSSFNYLNSSVVYSLMRTKSNFEALKQEKVR